MYWHHLVPLKTKQNPISKTNYAVTVMHIHQMYAYTVQLTSKLTLACAEHTCVLQFLSGS